MISIIVCSVNAGLLRQLKENVNATIGVPFEIIGIDNTIQPKSLASVYNEGTRKAEFDILCFLHEDVKLHNKDWGRDLSTILADRTVGLVGVSGAVYKSRFAGTWASCDKSLYRTHSIQQFNEKVEPVVTCINPGNVAFSQVAIIDGVFMATRKDVFSVFQFDDDHFNAFHAYDLDYSLQVGTRYKVVVTFGILLEHFSPGQLNRQWLDASIVLHHKWRHVLPISSEIVSKNVAALSDSLACALVMMITIRYKGSKLSVLNNYIKLLTIFIRFNRLKHTKTVLKYLLSKRQDESESQRISFS